MNKALIKRIFCKHKYTLVSSDNDLSYYVLKCYKCNKTKAEENHN